MQNSEEMINVVGDQIRNILENCLGKTNSPETCNTVKANIIGYLNAIQSKLGYPRIPEVMVELDGPFVTVNFLDNQGFRLETLGDMLEFMENAPMSRFR